MPISTQLQGESLNDQSTVVLIQNGLDLLPDSSQLLAVSEQRRSGLILCKQHHAEFAGPGAAVGSSVEQPYRAVIAIGYPNLVPVISHEDRQKAYSRRIQWGRWLHKIVDNPDPILRAEKLFSSFEEFFGYQVAVNLPDKVLAMLIGVLPQTIQMVRMQHRGSGKLTEGGTKTGSELVKTGEIAFKYYDATFLEESNICEFSATAADNLYKLPYSA